MAAVLIVGAVSGAAQQRLPQAPGGEPGRRPRFPAIPSEVVTHSTLVPCTSGMAPQPAPRRLRVATWNIRAARSAPLQDIAAELSAMDADVVALQEVDLGVRRTGFVDQPSLLATALNYQYAFAASIKWDEGDYGLAILSRWPLSDVRRHNLDDIDSRERRIVLETTVCAGGRPLRLFNHHADVRAPSRDAGLAELKTIVQPDVGHGILVVGDFNEGPDAAGVRTLLGAGLVDLGASGNSKTIGSERVDYLLADPPLAGLTSGTHVWATGKSDHNAVFADLEW